MTTFALSVLLQVSVAATPDSSYTEALAQSLHTGQPLVVLVGAVWCPACVRMKKSILPEVERAGGLKDVALAYVDVDRQPELAAQLTRGSSIPQLIRFGQRGTSWEKQLLTGAHSPPKVAAFIQGGTDEKTTVGGWGAVLNSWTEGALGRKPTP